MKSNIFKIFGTTEAKSGSASSDKPVVPDKEAARNCLALADQHIKEGRLDKARAELDKAKKLDPTNTYIDAFRERILFFEQQRKKEILEKARLATQKKQRSEEQSSQSESVEVREQPVEREEMMNQTSAVSEESKQIEEEKIHVTEVTQTESERKKQGFETRVFPLQDNKQRSAEETRGTVDLQRPPQEIQQQAYAQATHKIEEETRRLEEERRFIEEERRRLEDERRRIEEEERLRARVDLKRLEADIQRKAEEEARRLGEERRRIEEERMKLEEERRKAEGEERRKIQAELQRLESEFKRRSEEEAQRYEELKRLETELQRKVNEETNRKLEEEPNKREQEYQKISHFSVQRKAEEETLRQTKAKKLGDFIARGREFLALQEFDEALTEITKVYGLDLSSEEIEEVKRLEEEIRRTEKLETKRYIQGELIEIKRQIDGLTHAIEQEKKAREELSKQNLQRAAKHYRRALEQAWVNRAPDNMRAAELHSLALTLSLPEAVEHSLRREVKLEMYGRAVKEAIAKRDLVRSSSSTLEWLRKVYDVTLDEYLEYESKFLTDLVADQYRGSILLVSSDPAVRDDTTARLKSLGYAVVVASTPDEALEKIEKIHPQFILCDTDFPQGRLSGIKFLHVLRGNPKFNYLPFILFCEHSSVSEIESSELRSSEGYVRKPVQFEELTDVMEKKLAKFKEYISSLSS